MASIRSGSAASWEAAKATCGGLSSMRTVVRDGASSPHVPGPVAGVEGDAVRSLSGHRGRDRAAGLGPRHTAVERDRGKRAAGPVRGHPGQRVGCRRGHLHRPGGPASRRSFESAPRGGSRRRGRLRFGFPADRIPEPETATARTTLAPSGSTPSEIVSAPMPPRRSVSARLQRSRPCAGNAAVAAVDRDRVAADARDRLRAGRGVDLDDDRRCCPRTTEWGSAAARALDARRRSAASRSPRARAARPGPPARRRPCRRLGPRARAGSRSGSSPRAGSLRSPPPRSRREPGSGRR